MVDKYIELSAVSGETGLTMKTFDADRELIASAAIAGAFGDSATAYRGLFADHAAGDVYVELVSSDGYVLTIADVTIGTAAGVYRPGVAVESLSQAALAQFVTDDTGQESASAGSVSKLAQGAGGGGGGGGTATLENQQTMLADLVIIKAQTSLITAGKLQYAGSSVEGTDDELFKGSDYRVRNNTAYPVRFSDPGATIKTLLTDAAQVASIIFGAGEQNRANDLIGSIDAANISHDSDITTILVEFTKAQLALSPVGTLHYHIKAIAPIVDDEADGDELVRITGCVPVRPARAIVAS